MSISDPAEARAPTLQIAVKSESAATTRVISDRMIGREVIGQYRIEKRLGDGGMGTVYLAQQTSVSRPAVIKVLGSQIGSRERFAVEARAASSLNHPNIVTIYNYGEMEDGTPFIAMEYLEGETLADRIVRCGPLPADRAVHIARQIAGALGEAHAHGVVHRDLKPSNVMLVARAGEPDFVKVLDFGIAKLDGEGLTLTGYAIGTPRYMSPEQLLGQPADRRSDVYSMGIVLYEMLVGQTPFSSETPIGWVRQHVDVKPKPPSVVVKDAKIPSALDRVVLLALAKVPSERPSSMEEFARTLEEALLAPVVVPPPWYRRVLFRTGRYLAAVARFVAIAALAIGSGTRRFVPTVARSAWRFCRAIGRGTWRFVRAVARGTWRFVRAVARGTWRFVRAIGSATRRFVLMPPVHLGRFLRRLLRAAVATRRRRVLVVVAVTLVVAVGLVARSPSVRDALWSDSSKLKLTPSIRSPSIRSPTKSTKPVKSGQHRPTRTPASDDQPGCHMTSLMQQLYPCTARPSSRD